MKTCSRCNKQASITIMATFNTQIICISCSDKERKRKDFNEARLADELAIEQGEYNFQGIDNS